MRPATLAEAIERIIGGEPQEKALPEFLDTFYLAPTAERKLASISDRPAETGDARLDAFVGAAAEYLARQYQLPKIPEWVFRTVAVSRSRLGTCRNSMIRRCANISTFASPAEFRSRNIFTEERPLRRARAKVA